MQKPKRKPKQKPKPKPKPKPKLITTEDDIHEDKVRYSTVLNQIAYDDNTVTCSA